MPSNIIISDNIEQIALKIPQMLRSGVEAVADDLINLLSREPGRSHSPVAWVSDAQRRAFFAQNSGAYHRSGKLSRSWRKRWAGEETLIIENTQPYSGWVQGEHQSIQHKLTGWISSNTAIEQADISAFEEEVLGGLRDGF